jgi:aryl-alcohol dehydrogenase-like predicted oxidoreductase
VTQLGIGTVQFGMGYSIASGGTQVELAEIRRIFAAANELEIRLIDTAHAYGDAEARIGNCRPTGAQFRIVTKTAPLKALRGTVDGARLAASSFAQSLARLGVERVAGLLVHHADDLIAPGGEYLWEALVRLREVGQAASVGVSVYNARQIDAILDRFDIDLIQLPINVFNQRLAREGYLTRLKEKGIEIHARSAFLQGLLLMNSDAVPAYLAPVQPILAEWRRTIAACGLSPVQGAFAYLRSVQSLDAVVLGIASETQLRENDADWRSANAIDVDFAAFAIDDEKIVNPGLWARAH